MNIRIDFLRVGSSRLNETIGYIAEITRREPHLLEQSRGALLEVAQAGRLLIACDQDADDCFVGCIMLWELEHPYGDESWYELGTIYVELEYRYPQIGFSVADMLYHKLLDSFQDLNVLGTTTNPNAIKAGERAGLKMSYFHDLPGWVENATCVCPPEKRQPSQLRTCSLKDRTCRVRLSEKAADTVRKMWMFSCSCMNK